MKLKGTKILLTGKFENIEELKENLIRRGAILCDTIARDVEYVVTGNERTRIADDAQELGIRTLDSDFLNQVLEKPEPEHQVETFSQQEFGEMPAYLREGPPVDDFYRPTEEYDDFGESVNMAATKANSKINSKDTSTSNSETTREKKEKTDGEIAKGSRVKIIGGKEGIGDIGDVFWLGENKYGPGMRAGVKTEKGITYWVDTNDLGSVDAHVSDTEIEASKENSKFGRGDDVRIISGEGVGATGTIFWWGESRFGPGMRAGVEAENGEKYWIDAENLEKDSST